VVSWTVTGLWSAEYSWIVVSWTQMDSGQLDTAGQCSELDSDWTVVSSGHSWTVVSAGQ